MNVAAVQETHFTCTGDCWVVFLTFSSHCSIEVSLLVECSLNVIVNLVFAGDRGWLVVADVVIKSFEFRMVAGYAPNSISKRHSFFRQLGPFFDDSKWLVLVGDWNVILDPKIDNSGRSVNGLGRCESSLIDLLAEFDLIGRFCQDHPGWEMWTWLEDLPFGQIQSYLDNVN